MKWQILLRKIRQVRKTMGKPNTNLCNQALIEGQNTCGGEDLLTECKEWCKKLKISKNVKKSQRRKPKI